MGHYWSEQIVVDVLIRSGEVQRNNGRDKIESGADQVAIVAAEICFYSEPAIQIELSGGLPSVEAGTHLESSWAGGTDYAGAQCDQRRTRDTLGIDMKIRVPARKQAAM